MVTKTSIQERFEKAFATGAPETFATSNLSIDENGNYVDQSVDRYYQLVSEYYAIIDKEPV